jgi:hypothetical protein
VRKSLPLKKYLHNNIFQIYSQILLKYTEFEKCYYCVHENGHLSLGAGGQLNQKCSSDGGTNRNHPWMWRVYIQNALWIFQGPNTDWAWTVVKGPNRFGLGMGVLNSLDSGLGPAGL